MVGGQDMTLKTLLLGSAAAFAVVGGAQAADLSVAEPVEYVKVCDYFGTGYFYIPGTDTCLKISGFVEENAQFHENEAIVTGSNPHSSSWNFGDYEKLVVSAKSMTEYGELDGVVSFAGSMGNSPGAGRGSTAIGEDGAWLSLGGFKAGAYQLAAWNSVYAYSDNDGVAGNFIYGTFNYTLLHTFQLNWAAGGMSAQLAVSDPSSFFGSSLPTNYSVPLITGQLGFGASGMSFNVSGGFVQLSAGSSWGVDGMVQIPIGKQDKIGFNAAYGDNEFIQNGWNGSGLSGGAVVANPATNNGFSFMGEWQHAFSPQLALQLEASWGQWAGGSTTNTNFTSSGYGLNADLVWTPVTNFTFTGAIVYSDDTNPNDVGGAWAASLTARRDF
jgi:hypothetical protein